ncbi:MAG: archaetidylserine decarboxylase [Pseudomonadales bacterium]|nr:archaetidylserine decarboxylase [Pseudomonadales bacterium]
MSDFLFILGQYLLPQHLLSRLVGRLAESRWPAFKNRFIHWFIGRYQVDLSEAVIHEPGEFACFNDFFTRALQADARPLAADPYCVLSPADGVISQVGAIDCGRILQAKGHDYSITALLGGDAARAEPFHSGSFATVYLSPKDYHRVHMPLAGRLQETIYVPGKLFSVNTLTSSRVSGLFARNERLVCLFATEHGPLALILVGAMIVAGIDTVWGGQVCPNQHGLQHTDFSNHVPVIQLARGEEMGRFKLGSTVIALFGPGMLSWAQTLGAGSPVHMGEALGRLLN